MDYSWLEVIKHSIEIIKLNSQKLQEASTGKKISDSDLTIVANQIVENTSRMSRLLSLEKNREIKEIIPTFFISSRDLAVLTPDFDGNIRKSLLSGDRQSFRSVTEKLFASTQLWEERIVQPIEMALLTQKPKEKKVIQSSNEMWPNNKAILLLGAGSSKPLQVPTMADFWPIILNNTHSEDEKIALDLLFETAKDETIILPPDLEKLLSLIDRYETYLDILWEDANFGFSSHALEYTGSFQPYLPWTKEKPEGQFLRKCGHASRGIAWTKKLISKIMDASFTRQFDQAEVLSLYQPLFSFINDGLRVNNISVFTTNYDTVIEQFCRHSGIKLVHGFQQSGPNLIWNPAEYYQKIDPSQKLVTLCKLHGSLTWRKIGNEIFEFGMSATNMPGGTALIYPTETKEYPYEEPFKTAYKLFDHSLKTAEVVIAIGYSFRDRSLMYIIDEAQSINPNLKFVIICGENPDVATHERFPYGSHLIEEYFTSGENPKYLARLSEIIKDIQK